MEYIHNIESPVGTLTVSSDGENVSGLWIAGQKYFAKTLGDAAGNQPGLPAGQNPPVFDTVEKWLDIYFSGEEPDFMPPLMPRGSLFQKTIWNILCKIPYGRTTTYGEVAKQFEMENKGRTSARAAGGAVGRNPVSILIPCHRVIGKKGDLTGYAGGVAIKRTLLQMEGIEISLG